MTLALDAATVSESAGQVAITATLDGPAPDGGVSLRLVPSPDDTAARDADYAMPHTTTITDDDTSDDAKYTVLPVDTVAVPNTAAEQEQRLANQPPTIASAIGDANITSESGTHQVSLSGVFSDAESDALPITANSSDFAVADAILFQGTLTVTAVSDGSPDLMKSRNFTLALRLTL